MINTSACFRVLNMDEIAGISESVNQKRFGFVYAIEYGEKIKIGCSKRPHFRISNLLKWANRYGGIKTGRVCLSPPHTNYRQMESFFHRVFSRFRICETELFDIGLDDFMQESEKYKSYFRFEDLTDNQKFSSMENFVENMFVIDKPKEITEEEKNLFANNLDYILEKVKEKVALYNKCIELLEELCDKSGAPSATE